MTRFAETLISLQDTARLQAIREAGEEQRLRQAFDAIRVSIAANAEAMRKWL